MGGYANLQMSGFAASYLHWDLEFCSKHWHWLTVCMQCCIEWLINTLLNLWNAKDAYIAPCNPRKAVSIQGAKYRDSKLSNSRRLCQCDDHDIDAGHLPPTARYMSSPKLARFLRNCIGGPQSSVLWSLTVCDSEIKAWSSILVWRLICTVTRG